MPSRSEVWKYFNKTADTVQCKLCEHKNRFFGSTSNMWRHVKHKHLPSREVNHTPSSSERLVDLSTEECCHSSESKKIKLEYEHEDDLEIEAETISFNGDGSQDGVNDSNELFGKFIAAELRSRTSDKRKKLITEIISLICSD